MSKFFIERPVLSNVIAIVTIVLGLVCLFELPVAQYPEIVPPTIRITTSYPGASAEVVAATVGIPIETAVNGVENSIYMQSTSGSDGSYALTVTFGVGTNLNAAVALIQNAVSGALSQLPSEVQQQGVTVQKISSNVLVIGSLYSDNGRFDETFLSNYAIINLQNPIARLPGVGGVEVLGAGPYSMRIWLDPIKLKAYGLTVTEVQKAIENQNVDVASGQLGGPPAPADQLVQLTVNTLGRLSDASQFENIILKANPPPTGAPQAEGLDGPQQTAQILRLKDVARVELSQQSYSTFSGLSGKKAAQINIYTLPGANALRVSRMVHDLMARLSAKFPKGLKYEAVLDTSSFVRDSIHGVYQALIEAGILVLVVIMLFLQNWRATLVPATTVPVTIIGAFAAMALLGFTVNLMTLFALILAIGIVVDDAIVIVENASHYIERGLSPKDAAIKAMEELTGPVLGVTLVLGSVFLPASFLPGITGQMFRQFALVIAATAIISALNALTLKPTQCALYLRPVDKDRKVNWFYRGFNRCYEAVEGAYIGVVSRIAHHPGAAACVFAVVVSAAGALFMIYPTTLLPLEDQGYCIVVGALAPGASQPRVHKVADDIDRVLKSVPGIKGWVTIGGYSALDRAKISNVITAFVVYREWDKRPPGFSQARLLVDLQKRFKAIREANFAVIPPSPIPGLGNAFGFQMMIEDRAAGKLSDLQTVTQKVLNTAKDRPGFLRLGFTTFNVNSPQLSIDIDRTMVRTLGVPLANVFQALQTYLGSSYINLFNKFNQSFQVRMQADARYRRDLPDISNLYVANRHGQMVPLGALLSIKRVLGSELITRFNLYPAATIIGVPDPRHYSSGQALNVMQQIGAANLPRTMDYEWAALSYQEKLIGHQVIYIFALSFTLVFLVLAAQYESWTDPAAVLITVPIALVGILAALVIRRFPVDQYTQIGLVLMIALAAKNAILIVEFARELKAEGMDTVAAAVEATRRRFRPIVMSSLAFILGVVPLLTATGAGAASQQSLGTVVFGGMLASTLLAIPFVPVFYILMEGLNERRRRRKGLEPSARNVTADQ
jgi:hydrophobic/amphiphilic exporter-1 (mainly G- bacteria), HAE1 family